MKLKIDKEKINKLSPEDAIPLFVKISRLIFGKKKPDGFTRIIFSINLFSWFLLFMWNMISYFVLLSSDIIKENKGFSVNAIIRRNGQKLGFNGQDFLDAITQFYFLNNFIWIIIFIGLILMYRKKAFYPFLLLGGLAIHFSLMFFTLGLQYFLEDVSFFDKILYAVIIVLTIIHSFLMKKEIHDREAEERELQL
ncbi:MAG: hypothetical protein COA32_16415 [Fluviicola sp.]|nr:MAG: hypothetical protein COA32_16415 [Fluviicola sp.]